MDDRYTTRHAPVRGPYYNYGGGNGWARDVPTTRTRAGRFEAPVQKNSWWKLKFQGAVGSTEPDRSQFAAISRGSFDAAVSRDAAHYLKAQCSYLSIHSRSTLMTKIAKGEKASGAADSRANAPSVRHPTIDAT